MTMGPVICGRNVEYGRKKWMLKICNTHYCPELFLNWEIVPDDQDVFGFDFEYLWTWGSEQDDNNPNLVVDGYLKPGSDIVFSLKGREIEEFLNQFYFGYWPGCSVSFIPGSAEELFSLVRKEVLNGISKDEHL